LGRKNESNLESVNRSVPEGIAVGEVVVEIRKIESAEIDEMWSFVEKKENQRWLWHAIDHATGIILAYVFGDRADAFFETEGSPEAFWDHLFPDGRLGSLRMPFAGRSACRRKTEYPIDRAQAFDAKNEN
jgi:hypothetical protein